ATRRRPAESDDRIRCPSPAADRARRIRRTRINGSPAHLAADPGRLIAPAGHAVLGPPEPRAERPVRAAGLHADLRGLLSLSDDGGASDAVRRLVAHQRRGLLEQRRALVVAYAGSKSTEPVRSIVIHPRSGKL